MREPPPFLVLSLNSHPGGDLMYIMPYHQQRFARHTNRTSSPHQARLHLHSEQQNTQPPISNPPATRMWTWDQFPDYQLNESIIHDFLQEKWGDYWFFIKVL